MAYGLDILWGWLWAAVILATQLSLGGELRRRFFDNQLSWPAAWGVGVALTALINVLFYALRLPEGIWLNLIWLWWFPSHVRQVCQAIKSHQVVLGLLFAVLLGHALNPVADWDSQETTLQNASHYVEQDAITSEHSFSPYSLRPQLVSLIWVWPISVHAEKACQFLDLSYFLIFAWWLAVFFKLSSWRLAVLVVAAGALTLGPNGDWQTPILYWLVGTANSDVFMWLMLAVVFECGLKIHRSNAWVWLLAAASLMITRWDGVLQVVILSACLLVFESHTRRFWPWLLSGMILGGVWYGVEYVVHGNPIYPVHPSIFGGSPMNVLMQQDFDGMTEIVERGQRGVRNLKDLWRYLLLVGPACLLFVPAAFKFKKHRHLVSAVMLLWLGQMSVTSQVEFVHAPLFLAGGLVLGEWHAVRKQKWLSGLLGALVLLGLPAIKERVLDGVYFVGNMRYGKDVLMSQNIRLWNACRWINTQVKNRDVVLWPMNPHYYAQAQVIRADHMAYQIPDHLLDDPPAIDAYLQHTLKARYIVWARPMYTLASERGARFAEKQMEYMIRQPHWQRVATLPAENASTEVEIYQLIDTNYE